MSSALPPEDLECPDPSGCTVAVTDLEALAASGRLSVEAFPASRHWYRVYDARDGYGQPNPGYGDTRFGPFDALATGLRVPTLYIAESLTSALLEASLHDVHVSTPRVVAEKALLGKLHAQLVPPRDLEFVDLRDPQLASLGLKRADISSSSAEHYPCTRRVARAIHAGPSGGRGPEGIVWHSRQAELTGRSPQEVAVVFADRVPHARDSWRLATHRQASGSLLEGSGRLLLDELAEELNVTISEDKSLDEK